MNYLYPNIRMVTTCKQAFRSFCLDDGTAFAPLSKLDNLFVALGIDDTKRKKELLLHYGGDRLSDIYATLVDPEKTYDAAKTVLNHCFEPKKI